MSSARQEEIEINKDDKNFCSYGKYIIGVFSSRDDVKISLTIAVDGMAVHLRHNEVLRLEDDKPSKRIFDYYNDVKNKI